MSQGAVLSAHGRAGHQGAGEGAWAMTQVISCPVPLRSVSPDASLVPEARPTQGRSSHWKPLNVD